MSPYRKLLLQREDKDDSSKLQANRVYSTQRVRCKEILHQIRRTMATDRTEAFDNEFDNMKQGSWLYERCKTQSTTLGSFFCT